MDVDAPIVILSQRQCELSYLIDELDSAIQLIDKQISALVIETLTFQMFEEAENLEDNKSTEREDLRMKAECLQELIQWQNTGCSSNPPASAACLGPDLFFEKHKRYKFDELMNSTECMELSLNHVENEDSDRSYDFDFNF